MRHVTASCVDADQALRDEEFVEVNFLPFPLYDDEAVAAAGADDILPLGEDLEVAFEEDIFGEDLSFFSDLRDLIARGHPEVGGLLVEALAITLTTAVGLILTLRGVDKVEAELGFALFVLHVEAVTIAISSGDEAALAEEFESCSGGFDRSEFIRKET